MITRREFLTLCIHSGAAAALSRLPFAPRVTAAPPLPVLTIPFGIGGTAPRAGRLAHNLYIPVVTNDR